VERLEAQKRTDSEQEGGILGEFLDPWFAGLDDPRGTQAKTMTELLAGYSKTEYGEKRAASSVGGTEEYREAFPVTSYRTLAPLLQRVREGDYSALLPETAQTWVMTRGTTGKSKVLPATETHLSQILGFGARAVVNFALKRDREVLEKPVLNLNFPSRVGEFETEGKGMSYGFSSGTYARLFPGTKKSDWGKRFELAYQTARNEDVGSLMGVTQVMVAFASYVKERHGERPRDFWRPRGLFCTSTAKIHTKYEPILRHSYGPVPVVEMYTATEGVFAQQRDELPYVCPNYDGYLFEVLSGKGAKMLHEMKVNEWGSLVVSTSMLPRYEIGDLIESLGKGYFRVFGRKGIRGRAEHYAFNMLTFRF